MSDRGLILELFGGPGGLSEGARMAGLERLAHLVAIELDAAACATRAAAGHRTIRADVAAFPLDRLITALILAIIGSPPCTTFSAAGDGAGNAITDLLAKLICDLFEGRDTRAEHRAAMARTLAESDWQRQSLPPGVRAAKIRQAVLSAALVAEPARFVAAARPEWVTLEQVPAVLPLWRTYAAQLRKLGYSAWCGILNAADYGVPQTRQRAILIASRTRTVRRPEPTHYDPHKGMQLWGTPWVSMAEALGWGATGRPVPTVTAGGTRTGGAEPFGHRDRDALEAERDTGAWALRIDAQRNATVRSASAPAPALKFGHSAANMQWVLHTNRDQRADGSRQTAGPQSAPALTAKSGGQWVLRTSFGEPSGERHGSHEMDPAERPSHAVTSKARNWSLRSGQSIAGEGRADLRSWVTERPATTLQGDPRVFPPHAGSKGEHQSTDSVRITVEEAAALQSFPPGYPFQGSKTKCFEQIGNAVPPLLAAHIFAEAAGLASSEAVT